MVRAPKYHGQSMVRAPKYHGQSMVRAPKYHGQSIYCRKVMEVSERKLKIIKTALDRR